MPDTMNLEILEDGTISISTDKISGTNHVSADEFIEEVAKAAGGEHTVQKKKNRFAHQHAHGHVHA